MNLNFSFFFRIPKSGDSGSGLYQHIDKNSYNKTLLQFKDNQLIKEKLKNFETIYNKLERKNLEGKFYLTGIVSLGINCGTTPGVYMNLNYHKDWLLEIVNDFDDHKFKL